MKKKLGIRALAVMLAASVVMSASTGMVSAKNYGASVSATSDVSDASAVSETASRSAQKTVSSTGVSVEGAALNTAKIPTGLSGAGTVASPYQIGSASDFLLMNSYINYESSSSKEFVLTSDIDLSKITFSDFTNFDGIWALVSAKASQSGNANVRFHLNGNGHKLFGLNAAVSKNASAAAVFGYVNANSSIENLELESCTLRVNSTTDGAYAVLAVQNYGMIRNCTLTDCVLDLRLGSVQSRANDESYLSKLPCGRVFIGHALGVADNIGKVQNFTVSGSDTNKGVFVKGGRRFIGVVAGQNRKEISGASVSGVRIVSYGSDDPESSISGKGVVAGYVGMIAGRNDKSASISDAKVALKYGSDILFGDPVGGIVGENAGSIEDSTVAGTVSTNAAATASTANLFGCGRYGAVAGANVGSITGCGAYNIGMMFARGDAQNAYGGICGTSSGSVEGCVACGNVQQQSSPAAGVGGIVGSVLPGMTIKGNYALVSVSDAGANTGALVGKGGTSAHIGQNNYWSSMSSGLETPAPGSGVGQNDLTPATPVVVLPRGTSGVTLNTSALVCTWQGGKVTAKPDFSKEMTISNKAIRLNKSASSVTLSSSDEGAIGTLNYSVSVSLTAGSSARTLSVRVCVPVFVTASNASGAGTTVKNPIVLTSAAQMQILRYAPAAHYKLGADITVGSDWTPVAFSGTLNGAGHTLQISKPLFSSVSGSRNGRVADADWKYVGSNLISGYIYDLKIVPTTCISGSVFGDVQNVTMRDVTYSVADDADGFVALSAAKSGALIDTISGNAFLYRCTVSVPIAVTADEADGIGALAGYVTAGSVIAENCTTTSLLSLDQNLANVGGLFGNIASVKSTAELTACSATGCVFVSKNVSDVRARIMIGAAANGVSASGCTYAAAGVVSNGSVAKEAAPFTKGITLLNAQSAQAKQGVEDTRSMLSLIDPELIEQADLADAVLSLEDGVYKLRTASDVADMASMINGVTSASDPYLTASYVLQNDIDMNGVALMMATDCRYPFKGTFTSAGSAKYTLSNFTVTRTTTEVANANFYYKTAAALFCYANGATFSNIAFSNVTVKNNGLGTAVLVGFADNNSGANSGAATMCTFTNIDFTDCEVNSTRSVNATGFSLTNVSQAGTLVGAVWSTSSGNLYNITGVTVTDCIVQNRSFDSTWDYYSDASYHDGGGGWAIGGLIGDSRVTSGTLVIGASGATPSVKMEHVTVIGYSCVGGVLGKAGNASSISSGSQQPAGTGSLSITNVTVKEGTEGRSVITAGNGAGVGGICGGLVGAEQVSAGGVQVNGCTVSKTNITSNQPLGSSSNNYADCGGIAGHLGGTVQSCTVVDCNITSCMAGGIVGRSSRKATTEAGTLLTVQNCTIKGETNITVGTSSSQANNYAGGIIAYAQNSSTYISGCSIGSKVTISGAFHFAGGFIGSTVCGNAYSATILNSMTLATVQILTLSGSGTNLSSVGGAVGNSNMALATGSSQSRLVITNCVLGGVLDCHTNLCGGIIGTYRPNTVCTGMITNCTVTAKINTNEDVPASSCGAMIIAWTPFAYQNTLWFGTAANVSGAISGIITSSYPASSVHYFGYCGTTTKVDFNTAAQTTYLKDASLLTAGVVHDVNKPDNTNYLHGSTNPVQINGNNSNDATVAITNTTSYTSSTPVRLQFDNTTSAADKQYNGWVSTANGYLVVKSTTTASSVDVTAKKTSTTVGITASYKVLDYNNSGAVFTDPDTSKPELLRVYIPVECSNIATASLTGHGTSTDPYQISSVEELDSLRFRDLSLGEYYSIVDDIIFDPNLFNPGNDYYNNGDYFLPIAGTNSGGAFHGTLYGNGHTISGLKIGGSAAKTGLFAETNGTEISNLTLADSTISSSGLYVGGLVGVATETEFYNITMNNVSVSGSANSSAYAGSLAAYVTDSTVKSITLTSTLDSGTNLPKAIVQNAYFTGGLFGHAHYSGTANKENKIEQVTINNLIVSSTQLATGTRYDGTHNGKVDAAGGIAAEFSGSINPETINPDTNLPVRSDATIAGTIRITGTNAGGAVGILDRTGDGDCTVNNVTIGSGSGTGNVQISSTRTLLGSAAAGGIVGKIRTNDSENQNSVPSVDLDIDACVIKSDVQVSGMHFAGGVLGHSGLNDGTIDITNTQSFAEVSSSLADGAVGAIVGRTYDLQNITISYCVASGSLTALTTAGGVIGLAQGTSRTSGSLITNTVFSASLSAANKGTLIGSVTIAVLPENLGTSPFTNIYYSSFRMSSPIAISSGSAYSAYQATYRDLQTGFFYSDGTQTLPLSQTDLTLTSASILLPSYKSSGDYQSFICPANVPFDLDTVKSESNSGILFTFNASTQTFSLVGAGSGSAVFCYENGIELGLSVIATDIQGSGTPGDPWLIEEISQLEMLSSFPSRHFILARDLDFSTQEGQDWADAWVYWADTLTATPFSGSLNGEYEEWDEIDERYVPNTHVHHTISGLEVAFNQTDLDDYLQNFNDKDASCIGGVGFLPVVDAGNTALVKNITFNDCSFTTDIADYNAGAVAGVVKSPLTGITVQDTTVSGGKHVGAVAGICYGAVTDCSVSAGTTVTATHCAGGVAGAAFSVSGCAVSGSSVTGTQYAGGIAGGNLFFNGATGDEVPQAYRTAAVTCSFTGCTVSGCTIRSAVSSTQSCVGGILGVAEAGNGGSQGAYYRSVSIVSCTVDDSSEITARGDSNSATTQTNYAGGIVGRLDDYYMGFEIRSCESYADVTVQGSAVGVNTAAGGVLGGATASVHHKPYINNATTFRFVNNVCSGTITSPRYAGGVIGVFNSNCKGSGGNTSNAIAGGPFASGNIISAQFSNISGIAGGDPQGVSNFGLFIGSCAAGSFADGFDPGTAMTDNYYSSYVCNELSGYANIVKFGTGSAVQNCELFDVAKDADGYSSFMVKNQYESEGSLVWSPDYEEYAIGTNYGSTYPATYDKPVQLIFAKGSGAFSPNFGDPNSSMTVYSSVTGTEQHALTLNDVLVHPDTSGYYSATSNVNVGGTMTPYTMSVTENDVSVTRKAAKLTVLQNPANCLESPKLVADLGYGLLVAINISDGPIRDGSELHPFLIPDGETFVYYFFGTYALEHPNNYLTKFFEQTADIDFDDIVSHLPTGTSFAPIGTSVKAFTGGYNGGGYRIYDFEYTVPNGQTVDDVGLFGYVTNNASESYHLKNLHIELKESSLESGTVTADNTGVGGGKYTGGLVGRYMSNLPITNCSVVYGTVWSEIVGTDALPSCVGGLVGQIGTASLINCFTSTNVRAGLLYTTENYNRFACGGLAGDVEAVSDNEVLKIDHCFCSSDVCGPWYVSGFVGRVGGRSSNSAWAIDVSVTNCSSTASVTCLKLSGNNSEISSVPTLVIGYAYPTNGEHFSGLRMDTGKVGYVYASNVFVGGVNATNYRGYNSTTKYYYYPTLFGLYPLDVDPDPDENATAAASSNIVFDVGSLGRISIPNGSSDENDNGIPDMMKANGKLYRTSGTTPYQIASIPTTAAAFTGSTTESLLTNSLYPVQAMTVADGTTADPYYGVFAQMAAIPVLTDAREADDVSSDRTYSGVTYPTSISKSVPIAGSSRTLSYLASKYSSATDTLAYPSGYDYKLIGNGSPRSSSDMKTDLLFNTGESGDTAFKVLRNSFLNSSNSVPRNEMVPYVRVAPSSSITVTRVPATDNTPAVTLTFTPHRNIRIGLVGSTHTVFIATERQLRAIMGSQTGGYETSGTKFYAAYNDAISGSTRKNILLCADIDFDPNNTSDPFTPITNFAGGSTGDTNFRGTFGFDGSNCEIRNIYINAGNTPAGLFGNFSDGSAKVSNLILRDPTVNGTGGYVGALVGRIDCNNAEINNCMVIGGTVTGTPSGNELRIGGLAGSMTQNGTGTVKVEHVGVVGTKVSVSGTGSKIYAGLLSGELALMAVNNTYTVGEIKASAMNIGGLAGYADTCTISGVVTSGYIANTNSSTVNGTLNGSDTDNSAGGIIGKALGSTTLTNVESTAFVDGTDNTYVGGIVGKAKSCSISQAIFAGSMKYINFNATPVTRSYIRVVPSSGSCSVTSAYYDKQLQFSTESTASITGKSTQQLVTGAGFPTNMLSNDGADAEDPDDDVYAFNLDRSKKCYPSPVSVTDIHAVTGDVGHVITDAFKAGLSFALTRIDVTYGGSEATVDAYNRISAKSPLSINTFDDDLSNDKTLALDTVTMDELKTDGTAYATEEAKYLTVNNNGLEPNRWARNTYTGARASLNTAGSNGTDKSTFFNEPAKSIYRFVLVKLVRLAEIDYVVNSSSTNWGSATDKITLMFSTDSGTQTFTSNAVTSMYQDSDTSTGTYSVKYEKIIIPDNPDSNADSMIYVNTLLPKGYKAAYSANYTQEELTAGYMGTMEQNSNVIQVPDSNSLTVKVKVLVTISKDPGWGIRDLTGGVS